jgi:hypothetical protein
MRVTEETVRRILAKFSHSYQGRFFIVEDAPECPGTVNTWYLLLRDLDDIHVKSAATDLLSQDLEWPPSPGKLRRRAVNISLGNHAPVSGYEAWEHCQRLAKKLPVAMSPNETRALEMIGGVWAVTHSEKPGVERAAFIRFYDELCAKEIRINSVIPEVAAVSNHNAPALPPERRLPEPQTTDAPEMTEDELKKRQQTVREIIKNGFSMPDEIRRS